MAVCALFLWPLLAQEKGDTVYTFRFVPEDDMFYVPWNGNGGELSRLAACVERYREEILDGRMPLRVDGYCSSFDSEVENLASAKIRSNRVKSELIVRQKLTEDCFITKNHSGSGDYVTVRLVIPAEWTVTMGDYTGTEAGETHAPDYLFEPGIYTLAAYNTPEDITISGTTATVVQETGNSTGTYISNAPGWLMTSVQEVTVEADTDYELTAEMHQQVRQLTLVIEPAGDAADRIETIEGTLSGAAGMLDFATGAYGAASDVALHFTKITEGSDAGKWRRYSAAYRHADLCRRQPGRHGS